MRLQSAVSTWLLFMTAVQVIHLWKVAEQMNYIDELYHGLKATLVLSIGPSTSEELRRHGILPDFEPSHPKMGFLVNEAAQCAGRLLEVKRAEHNLVKIASCVSQ